MKHFLKTILGAFAVAMLFNVSVLAQDFPVEDQELYDFFQSVPKDYSLLKRSKGTARSTSLYGLRPDHVNNQATIFFPPIFNQSGGSCGSCANVAYMLCYEINTLRSQDGKHNADYQLPSHFSWLTCSNSCTESTMAIKNGIPSVTTYGGRTYSRYFGLQDAEEKDAGWMQGYDKWYSAMFNRARSMGKFPVGMETEEGKEMARQWLWNHMGDGDFNTGGVFVIGVAAGPEYTKFPNTAANREAGVTDLLYVTTWGPKYNHALTVVGYDDRVEFDLDSNGIIGEKDKGETGAWIIANSWGEGWASKGIIYCPYAYTYCVGLSGNAWDPAFYHPRKDYRPLRTIKLLMDYSKRPELCLCAGIAQDTSATKPEFTTTFAHFNYTGSGKTGSNDIPMLGRWADGYHYEPMEFGYDLTDLTENFDRTKPLKYFFYITTKYSASGTGNIYKASIMDYEFDREGIEIPFQIDTVAILNKGKTTMISVVVPGEQTYKPLNLQLDHNNLVWQAPLKSNLKLKGYNIYNNKVKMASVDANTLTYALALPLSGTYTVAAVYDYMGQDNVSGMSNAVHEAPSLAEKTNTVLELKQSTIIVPNAIEDDLQKATIEFWLKPYTTTSYNQQIGLDWGTFLFHTTSGGQIYTGWNTGSDRICSSDRLLPLNTWTHVAITIDNNVLTLYVNGSKKGSLTSANYSGLAAINNFRIGDNYYKFNGAIDEFRIWSTCRTTAEIMSNMRTHIANPEAQPDLICYLNMDKIESDGCVEIPEYGGNHNVDITYSANCQIIEDASLLTDASTLSYASFALSDSKIVKGESVEANPSVSLNAVRMEWSAPGAKNPTSTMTRPTFAYDEAGEYEITMRVFDKQDNVTEVKKTLTVEEAPLPTADFDIALDNIPAGDKVSLINRSIGRNCTYRWSLPGAQTTSLQSTNAAAVYTETGSHPITLTVTNPSGSASITKFVTIKNTLPAVKFDIAPANVLVGEKVSLIDQTKYEPTKWMWSVKNDCHNIGISGQAYDLEMTAPGVYDVTLTATNEVGTSSYTQNRAIFVSNANPQNGLNFVGNGEQVSFKSPVSATTKAFTIDYWLYPYTAEGAMDLLSDDEIMSYSTDANGQTTLTINGKSASSGEGYVIPNEWHHYAVTFKSGTVTYFRDGDKFAQASSRLALSSPAWTGNITMGAGQKPFNGMIDEFKFWNKSLVVKDFQATCNAPIANPDSMSKEGGLVIYYDFNQSTGDVLCATGSEYDGTRLGFGPDGDAWTSSEGVFTLDFTEKAVETDVTSEYLTNYKAPFLHTDERVNTTNYVSRFYQLEQETAQSGWVVENAIIDGATVTGTHVDVYLDGAMSCATGSLGYATTLNDQRTYQTVVLPAGHYKLTITPNETEFAESGSYIVVNAGDTLLGNAKVQDALAYSYLDTKELEFDIFEDDTKVSLGVIFNLNNTRTVAISEFTLTRVPCYYINAEELSLVIGNASGDRKGGFRVEDGGIRSLGSEPIVIVTLQGVRLPIDSCKQGTLISLPKGIYIVNGQKVEIK